MASLIKRESGIWYGRHIYYVNGKRKERWKSFGTSDDTEAGRRFTAWEKRQIAQRWGEIPDIPFEEASRRFFEVHCKGLSAKTTQRYRFSEKQLKPFFDGKKIHTISRRHLMEFESSRRKDPGRYTGRLVTPSSIRRDLLCLSSMFTYWIEEEWVETNPVTGFLKRRKKAGLKEGQPRRRYLSHDEESRLTLSALQRSEKIAEREDYERAEHLRRMLHAAIVTSIGAGPRDDELFRLKRCDVQTSGDAHILIRRGKGNKTRKVPLFEHVAKVLAALPVHPRCSYVFWWGDGKRLTDVDTAFHTCTARAGITDLIWHDLRRSCGCRLLQDYGASMEEVSKWLGHSSVTVTERHYAFLAEDALSNIVLRNHGKGPMRSAKILPLRSERG